MNENHKTTKSESENKRKFEYLDDLPSDAGFIAYGKSIKELFENSASALFSIIADINKIQPKKQIKILLSAKDVEELLYAFLSQIIAESEINELFFSKAKVKISFDETKNEYQLKAELLGEEQSEEKGRNLVKAITLHDFSIKKENNEYVAKIYVDL